MSRIIRISENLYNSIRDDSTFEDTPNSVLIRWAKEMGKYKEVHAKTESLLSNTKHVNKKNILLSRSLNLTSEKSLLIPVVKALAEMGGRARAVEVTDKVISMVNPSKDDLEKLRNMSNVTILNDMPNKNL